MTTTTKPSKRDRAFDELAKSKFRRNPILLFILTSVLVHGIILVIFAWFERSQPLVRQDPNPAPIDFIVIPPEESSPIEPSKAAANTLPKGENQPGKALEPEPEPPTPENTEPVAPPQTVAVPESIPESSPTEAQPPEETKPEPVAPPPPANVPTENQNSAEILSGSDTASVPVEETENKAPETTDSVESPTDVTESEDALATRLPPQITPTQPPETNKPTSPPRELPATPPTSDALTPSTDSSAASLLGGNYKRSLEDDGGASFFDLQANASQQAYDTALLDAQQNIDMRKYFSEIQRRVRRNWNPNSPREEYTTVLNFTIQRNGQITGLTVRQTSGSQEVDRETLEAVQDSAPFDPLPANFPLDSLNIEFSFNIYLY